MRLIDADALEDKFGCSDADILAKEEIRDAPTIDAVPVVRCKDYKHEYIERANLAERIKYYITHTSEDSGEHYAWSIALNEVLNYPTADVVPASQERIYKDLLDALFEDVRSLDTTLVDTCCMCSKGECGDCNLRIFEDELSAILSRAAERKKRLTD